MASGVRHGDNNMAVRRKVCIDQDQSGCVHDVSFKDLVQLPLAYASSMLLNPVYIITY